jgi:hypothetical protein
MDNKKHRLVVSDGTIKNQNGEVIGAILEDASSEDIAAIEISHDIIEAAQQFIKEPNKLRSSVKIFETLLEKHQLIQQNH